MKLIKTHRYPLRLYTFMQMMRLLQYHILFAHTLSLSVELLKIDIRFKYLSIMNICIATGIHTCSFETFCSVSGGNVVGSHRIRFVYSVVKIQWNVASRHVCLFSPVEISLNQLWKTLFAFYSPFPLSWIIDNSIKHVSTYVAFVISEEFILSSTEVLICLCMYNTYLHT